MIATMPFDPNAPPPLDSRRDGQRFFRFSNIIERHLFIGGKINRARAI
jgi:hypothetical protein